MIKVERPSPLSPEVSALVNAAGAARQALLDAFNRKQKPTVEERYYRAYKSHLMAAFHDKCAYCDSLITNTHAGDVEHYRPKNRVRKNDFSKIEMDYPDWGRLEHLGYFWLAYDWENLLPACEFCNRYQKHQGIGAGKGDRFPVRDFRAFLPGQEDDEEPLLIDPTRVDPDPHFEFHEDGTMKGLTDEGRTTIDLLGLNVRERLVRERWKAYNGAQRALDELLNSDDMPRIRMLRLEVNDIWEGREPHTAHGRQGMKKLLSRYRRIGSPIAMPIPPLMD